MKCKQFIPTVISVAVLVTANGLSTAAEAQDPKKTEPMLEQIDLREEIASPVAGEFTPAGNAARSGWQQDFGGTSGTANGMDGFPTATDEPSAYPAPGSSDMGNSPNNSGGSSNPY